MFLSVKPKKYFVPLSFQSINRDSPLNYEAFSRQPFCRDAFPACLDHSTFRCVQRPHRAFHSPKLARVARMPHPPFTIGLGARVDRPVGSGCRCAAAHEGITRGGTAAADRHQSWSSAGCDVMARALRLPSRCLLGGGVFIADATQPVWVE